MFDLLSQKIGLINTEIFLENTLVVTFNYLHFIFCKYDTIEIKKRSEIFAPRVLREIF